MGTGLITFHVLRSSPPRFNTPCEAKHVDASKTPTHSREVSLIKLRDGRLVGVEVVRALDEQLARGRGTRARIKRQLRDALTKLKINAWVNVSLTEGMAGYLNGEPELLRRELDAIAALAADVAGKLGETWLYYKRTSAVFDELDNDEVSLEGTGVGYVRSVAFLAHEEPLVWV